MTDIKIAAIVTLGEDNTISKDGKLPWDLPKNLIHFAAKTNECPIIIGRKAFQALSSYHAFFANRLVIVVTHTFKSEVARDVLVEGGSISCDIDVALKTAEYWCKANNASKIWIVGGGQIFDQTKHLWDELYITRVRENFGGDVKFPEIKLPRDMYANYDPSCDWWLADCSNWLTYLNTHSHIFRFEDYHKKTFTKT